MPTLVFNRLVDELAALPIHANRDATFCLQIWAVEFLVELCLDEPDLPTVTPA